MEKCHFCGSSSVIRMDSYKHFWDLCRSCRCARSIKKERYPLEKFGFLLRPYLRSKHWIQTENRLFKEKVRPTDPWEEFNKEDFIRYSQKIAEMTYQENFKQYGLDLNDKEILEISGGSGDIVNHLLSKGAKSVFVSEYNRDVVENIKKRLGIPAFFYDANNQTLSEAMNEGGLDSQNTKFDYILTRAIVMWCVDVEKFLKDLMNQLKDDGKIIIDTSVMPTIGVILWSQWSDYNYTHLYSPEFLEDIFERLGLEILHKNRQPDHVMNAFWMDRYPIERRMALYYEWKAVNTMQFDAEEFTRLEFNARDVRSYRYILQKR